MCLILLKLFGTISHVNYPTISAGTSFQHKLVAAISGGKLFGGSVLLASAAPVVTPHLIQF